MHTNKIQAPNFKKSNYYEKKKNMNLRINPSLTSISLINQKIEKKTTSGETNLLEFEETSGERELRHRHLELQNLTTNKERKKQRVSLLSHTQGFIYYGAMLIRWWEAVDPQDHGFDPRDLDFHSDVAKIYTVGFDTSLAVGPVND